MTKDEALRLALEALEMFCEHGAILRPIETRDAIKAALEAKDEPVAWKWHQAPVKTSWGDGMVVADLAIDKDHTASIYCERDQTAKVEAMFTQPHQEAKDEPVQKPWAVARVDDLERGGRTRALAMMLGLDAPLYATPPQRKPLTDEEINALDYSGTRIEFVRAIEAAHGIKGEA